MDNKKIEELIRDAQKITKKGGVLCVMAIPELTEEQFEQWQIGNSSIKGLHYLESEATGKTLFAFYNSLQRMENDLEKEYPMLQVATLVSNIKNSMVINEEDLEDDEH